MSSLLGSVWPFGGSPAPKQQQQQQQQQQQPNSLSPTDAANPRINALNPDGLKPCCACPITKKARDDCFLAYGSNIDDDGESREKCREIVQQHIACMRGYGFKV